MFGTPSFVKKALIRLPLSPPQSPSSQFNQLRYAHDSSMKMQRNLPAQKLIPSCISWLTSLMLWQSVSICKKKMQITLKLTKKAYYINTKRGPLPDKESLIFRSTKTYSEGKTVLVEYIEERNQKRRHSNDQFHHETLKIMLMISKQNHIDLANVESETLALARFPYCTNYLLTIILRN